MTGRVPHVIEPLLRCLHRPLTSEQRHLVERAYTVAAYWHRDQRRRSGDPYITHPIAVATIVAELGGDHELVCAALLHDVPEEAEPAAEFGEPVAALLTGLRDLERSGRVESCTDERVLLLKLADRLHNQRTIRFLPPDRQRVKSRETLDVLVPLAGRLGLDRMRWELEALAKAGLADPGQPGVGLSFHALAAGAVLLPRRSRARWLEEWLSDLQALPDRRTRTRFAVQLLAGMPRLAAALRRPARELGRLTAVRVLRAAHWVIRSDVRVWTLLTPLVAWMTIQAAAGNPGDAVAVLITVPPVLGAGVRAARTRLGEPARRSRDER